MSINLSEAEHASSPQMHDARANLQKVILRCYVYRASEGHFVAECIDLDIIVEEGSLNKAFKSINEAIAGYMKVACAGDIHGLIPRRSPISRRFLYHYRVLIYPLLRYFQQERRERRLKKFDVGASLCY